MVAAGIVAWSCAQVGRWNLTIVALLVSIVAGTAFRASFDPRL